jgi:hypothetical protein
MMCNTILVRCLALSPVNTTDFTITQGNVETRMLPKISENFKAMDQDKSLIYD